jgi:hypothetical protein
MVLRWKLTRPIRKYRECDALVLSIAKSGRTWLRVLINKYISLAYDVPFEVDDMSGLKEGIPSIVYTHEAWSHRTIATPKEYVLGTFNLPDSLLFSKRLLFMYRDPRDTVVSLYFEATKRDRRTRGKLDLRMGDFIRDRRFGIYSVVEVMNHWHERFKSHPSLARLSYEALHADTEGELSRVLDFMGFAPVDRGAVNEAVEFSRFENMKKMEKNDKFGKSRLRPTDPNDPDSYKVRKGKVGGYTEYLTGEDLNYANAAMGELGPSFGYLL